MRLLSIVAGFTAFLLVGCSTAPTVVSPAGFAAYEALETDVHLRYWVDACQKQSSQLRQLAQQTYQGWWQRNGELIEAADFGLGYGILRVSEDRVETGARLAMGMTWNMVEHAELDLARHFVPDNADKICSQVLEDYQNGKFDIAKLNKDKEFADLKRFQEAKQDDLLRRHTFVVNKTGKDYGRSFYVVEKLLQQENCVTSDINLVKNDWPHELYEANCPGKVYKLLQCEWGSCRTLR